MFVNFDNFSCLILPQVAKSANPQDVYYSGLSQYIKIKMQALPPPQEKTALKKFSLIRVNNSDVERKTKFVIAEPCDFVYVQKNKCFIYTRELQTSTLQSWTNVNILIYGG